MNAEIMLAAIRTIYYNVVVPLSDCWLKKLLMSMWIHGGMVLKRNLESKPGSIYSLAIDAPLFMVDLAERSLDTSDNGLHWQCSRCARYMRFDRTMIRASMRCSSCGNSEVSDGARKCSFSYRLLID